MAANTNIGRLQKNFGFIDPSVKSRHAGFLPGDSSGNVMWGYILTKLDGPENEEDYWEDDYETVATA